MKSWLRSAALAVASAVAITGVPAIANAAPTAPTASPTHAADTSSIQEKQHALKDTLVHAAKHSKVLQPPPTATPSPLNTVFSQSIKKTAR